MSKSVLVTGGAGFIGSFLVDKLLENGHRVRIFDSLEDQVHLGNVPEHLNKNAEFIRGNVSNRNLLKDSLDGMDVVFHFAAAVGVGQSMYQISKYTEDNVMGTAHLLNILANENHDVKKVIVAGSMSSYGEGLYACDRCRLNSKPGGRREENINGGKWEHICGCGGTLYPLPTPEDASLDSKSLYALTKSMQEKMTLSVCEAYGIDAVSMRFFNVYGPRQSLSNPYTGVIAIFMSRLKNKNPPIVYEDGNQKRDFISVHDIVDANIAAMNRSFGHNIFNVGTGIGTSISDIGRILARIYGADIEPKITNEFRKGDIRHCIADISKIREKLGWEPKVRLEDGLREIVKWSGGVTAVDKFENATDELRKRGLI